MNRRLLFADVVDVIIQISFFEFGDIMPGFLADIPEKRRNIMETDGNTSKLSKSFLGDIVQVNKFKKTLDKALKEWYNTKAVPRGSKAAWLYGQKFFKKI